LVPIFSKLLNFGPHISKLLQSPQEGLQGPQILSAKVKKQESYEESNFDENFDFLEIGKLCSTYFDVFGKDPGMATTLNFGPDFLENGELWSTYLRIIRKP